MCECKSKYAHVLMRFFKNNTFQEIMFIMYALAEIGFEEKQEISRAFMSVVHAYTRTKLFSLRVALMLKK